ncbi:hypothetical protein BDF20DRAFT_839299 [Mycotypha africana]|uniref:uncharacterized protein n=1 Tax=Mycotypha africana TaxID=64632 RepID=UPI002300D9D4|nr:uncharacterized protein BDF20DRAFT_839299 [Mycotypha africana]KAI8968176.1 hypothetical protein BDF20DRAFT_839299 [Mycotypha africana]
MISNSKKWWQRTSVTSDTAKIPLKNKTSSNNIDNINSKNQIGNNTDTTDDIPIIVMNEGDSSLDIKKDNFSTTALKGSKLSNDDDTHNETDTEGERTASIYSYGDSVFAPSSIYNVTPSMRVLRGKSEVSSKTDEGREWNGSNTNNNYSDIESTTSILNKPWISSQVLSDSSSKSADLDTTMNHRVDHNDLVEPNAQSRQNENDVHNKTDDYTIRTVEAANCTGDRPNRLLNVTTEPSKRRGSLGRLKLEITVILITGHFIWSLFLLGWIRTLVKWQ